MTALDDGVQTTTKRCIRCNEYKSLDDFYFVPSKGMHYDYCRPCTKIKNKENNERRKHRSSEGLDRVQKFTQRFLPTSELSDEEIQGSFIYNDHGQKVSIHDLPKVFQTKFSSELSVRLNAYLRQKTPRALEVIFDIIDSDLVEPADRLKASTWWVERIIGKTPEKLEMTLGSQPHETIFENLSGGSREAHRAQAIGQAIDAEVIENYEEAQIEDDDLEAKSGVERYSQSRQDLSEVHEEPGSSEQLSGVFSDKDAEQTTENLADEVVDKKNQAKELKKRIAEAKKKRYAARAVGASSLASMGMLIDWRVAEGGLLACLVMPETLTPAKLAVIESNDEQTNDEKFVLTQQAIIQADKLAKQVERARLKAERIKQNGF